ncbi:MAG: Uncharacterized protein FD126_472 [Elusimicrobia bacterium]|nr:MAG: Uncharacterized protein FD126_472 [Elusimicrobiota bacterium]
MKNGLMVLAAAALAAAHAGAAGSEADFSRAVGLAMASAVKSAKAFEPRPAASFAAIEPAQAPEGRLVSDKTTNVMVELNTKTVKCSAQDYSMPMLKVLVPALADLTLLNHRNTREGAPCVAAGQCGKFKPGDILASGEGTEQIPVRVVLRKLAEVDGEGCHVTLIETVSTKIRGIGFFHERRHELADRVADDCR